MTHQRIFTTLVFIAAAIASLPAAASQPNGALQSRVFMVFDEDTRTVVRKRYTVWDEAPEKRLEFEWIADSPSAAEPELVSGRGELRWRRAGASSYDRAALVSIYRGDMKQGRPDGEGVLKTRDGGRYEGEWRGGLYQGRGRLQLPDGSNYVGTFETGKFAGDGTLIAADGETYVGPFVDGLKHGRGKSRLPSGASYQSAWTRGIESLESRYQSLAQGTPFQPLQFSDGDNIVRFSFQVDQWPFDAERLFEPIDYNADVQPSEVRIGPDDKKLMSAWRGTGSISENYMGYADGGKAYFAVPLNVRLNVSRDVTIQKSYIEIEESLTDWQPLYALYFPSGQDDPCPTELTKFAFRNHGWGIPPRVRLQFAFATPAKTGVAAAPAQSTPAKTVSIVSRPLGSVVYNFASDLAQYGVVVNKLPSCKGLSDAACYDKAVRSGGLGRLAPMTAAIGGYLKTRATGRLMYAWTDAKRKVHSTSAPYAFDLFLNARPAPPGVCAEAGSGPEQDPSSRMPVDFKLDKANYRVDLPFRRTIKSGQSASLPLLLDADRSSQHRFRVVIEAANGKTYKSQPVALTYLSPRIHFTDFHMNPFEETDEERGIEP